MGIVQGRLYKDAKMGQNNVGYHANKGLYYVCHLKDFLFPQFLEYHIQGRRKQKQLRNRTDNR